MRLSDFGSAVTTFRRSALDEDTAAGHSAQMTLCRDCRGGSSPTYTSQQMEALIERLARGLRGRTLRLTECLGACDHANVVVVTPSRVQRARGSRPHWFGFINDDVAADAIAAWVRAGGPGAAGIPEVADLHTIEPPHRFRSKNR